MKDIADILEWEMDKEIFYKFMNTEIIKELFEIDNEQGLIRIRKKGNVWTSFCLFELLKYNGLINEKIDERKVFIKENGISINSDMSSACVARRYSDLQEQMQRILQNIIKMRVELPE